MVKGSNLSRSPGQCTGQIDTDLPALNEINNAKAWSLITGILKVTTGQLGVLLKDVDAHLGTGRRGTCALASILYRIYMAVRDIFHGAFLLAEQDEEDRVGERRDVRVSGKVGTREVRGLMPDKV